ncbi:MAG: DUF4965 domain-containing protein [Armatimonadia bacterium]|nr:DUF4965 domain-containing protein [Armatimonadia bacterium]
MILTESILAPLGSRFSINFRPQRRDIRVSALGRFLDFTADLIIGVRLSTGETRVLPFTSEGQVFEYMEQELTPSSIRFKARSVELGCLLEVTFTSPFYPQDAKLSTAPFFYVDIRVEPIKDMVHWHRVDGSVSRKGEVFVGLRRPSMAMGMDETAAFWTGQLPLKENNQGIDPTLDVLPDDERGESVEAVERAEILRGEFMPSGDRVAASFDLDADDFYASFIWAAHVKEPVLADQGQPTRFKYTEWFRDAAAVCTYARAKETDIRRRTALFDSLILDSSLGKTQQDFIAYTLQSYLSNTWWTLHDDGSDWFSVWEGVCLFNSTIDVEYNLGLLYYALWPELLDITFRQWERHEKTSEVGHFLSHDMGGGVKVNGQSYPHEMEVEENANFLLMLHAYWRWTGDDGPVKRHAGMCKRLVQYLVDADTNGNGFANEGTANTIDDASAAVQYSREQTYLGVKCLCAFDVAAVMADHVGDGDLGALCRQRADLIRETLDRDAWLGDHYAVCLDKSPEGLQDIWDKSSLPPGELAGWDAYSIYASNGMLYPLLVGHTPPVSMDRMLEDLEGGVREALIEYGCTHSSADQSNIWISQNLWRDFIGAYMGVDLLDMVDRYWAFLLQENTRPEGKCFIDTYVANNLCYYPRGITSIGMFLAGLGMSLDRVDGVMSLRPPRVPCRMPLLPLADWEAEEIPWVEYRLEDGEVTADVDGELPEGLDVRL